MLKIWLKRIIAEIINYNVKINWMIRYMKGMIIQSYAILDVSIYLQMGIYQYISLKKIFSSISRCIKKAIFAVPCQITEN